MSIDQRLAKTGTLHPWTAGGRDPASGDYDDPGWGTGRSVRCNLRQQKSTETRDGGLVVTTSWLLFLEPGVPSVAAQDEVTVAGMGRWAFEGDPVLVTNPRTDRPHHWEGIVRRVT